MTLKNNRAPPLSNIKLYASFHRNMWIQTGVTVRKLLKGVMTSVTLTFELWPWPFAWTSLPPLVITPEHFMMIRWWEHCRKVWRTDGRTDRRTDGQTNRQTDRQTNIPTTSSYGKFLHGCLQSSPIEIFLAYQVAHPQLWVRCSSPIMCPCCLILPGIIHGLLGYFWWLVPWWYVCNHVLGGKIYMKWI